MGHFKSEVTSGLKHYCEDFEWNNKQELPIWNDENKKFLENNFFVLCGVSVKKENIRFIDDKIKSLKRLFFGTEFVEIKSTFLRNPKLSKKEYEDKFFISREKIVEFGNLFHQIIEDNSDRIELIATIFDKRQYKNRELPDNNPFLKSVQVFFERIQKSSRFTEVVFDQMESSLQKTKGKHGEIMSIHASNGSMNRCYMDEYPCIINIEFQESSKENMLQIADICAYTVRRQFMQFGKEWIEGDRTCNLYEYFEKIRCHFYSNAGRVVGYGLVLIPNFKKNNWVIQEGCENKKTPLLGSEVLLETVPSAGIHIRREVD